MLEEKLPPLIREKGYRCSECRFYAYAYTNEPDKHPFIHAANVLPFGEACALEGVVHDVGYCMLVREAIMVTAYYNVCGKYRSMDNVEDIEYD